MNLLQIQNAYKAYGRKVLFDQAGFSINQGEHVGVIGPNGAGKTTLFKIIVGRESLDEGEITKANKLKIGYLEQEAELDLDQSADHILSETCTLPKWELRRHGRDLGLEESLYLRPLRELSGGYRMRIKLLQLLGQEPDLLLMDEPTNFLDLESVLALESFLQGYKGAFLLISHDREFLKRTTEATLEVEGGDIAKFPGHIDDYFEQKAQLQDTLKAQAANLALKRKALQAFVDRFKAKASKARQAQSRMKQLEKMETIESKDLPVRTRIRIPPPFPTGKEVLKLNKAQIGYSSEVVVLKDVNLILERGAHVGVVGVNGAGKSTFLKTLFGSLPLLAGVRQEGYQVKLSYFSQHVAEQLLAQETVLDALSREAHRDLTLQDVLNMAGSLLFTGDDVKKPIRVLSGGEKSRVALGQMLLKKSPVLILDEPTNHLDFDTVEALTGALKNYEGTVVVVSHDRGFIGRIANRILEIRNNRVEYYPGTYDEYVWSLQKGALKERLEDNSGEPTQLRPDVKKEERNQDNVSKINRDQLRKLNQEIRSQEKLLTGIEKKLSQEITLRDQLNKDLVTASGPEIKDKIASLSFCTKRIEELECEMMIVMEKLEKNRKEIE